jgi:hypothetical protein
MATGIDFVLREALLFAKRCGGNFLVRGPCHVKLRSIASLDGAPPRKQAKTAATAQSVRKVTACAKLKHRRCKNGPKQSQCELRCFALVSPQRSTKTLEGSLDCR